MNKARVLVLGALACLMTTCDLNSEPEKAPVVVIAVDALDPYIVMVMTSQGELPALESLMDHGAHGILDSEREIRSPALWTTVATGRPRDVHGIYDFVTGSKYWPASLRNERRRLVTSDMRRVPALWNYATEAGRTSVVVGWLNTWPAEEIEGVMVAPYVALGQSKQITIKGGVYTDVSNQVSPEERWEDLRPLVRSKDNMDEEAQAFVGTGHDQLLEAYPILRRYEDALRWSLAHTATMHALTLSLMESEEPDLTMVYFEGADSLAHRFWLFRESEGHIARTLRAVDLPSTHAHALATVYGEVVAQYYRHVDAKIGQIIAAAPENATILVVSDHGFGPWRERVPPLASTPFTGQHRLEGFVALAGPEVPEGSALYGATLYDIAPTVLNAMGLPIPEELEGHVLKPTVLEKIESLPDTETENDVEREEIERLESLGYVE